MTDLDQKIPSRTARLIAYYLPQFHPIPENDEWWGKGFTEWTNTAKAKPLFKGHHQPNVPADLGFYDLRLPEARIAQAELAREYGIEGFCYWHYWFNGKRLLERPFNEVLKTGQPDFPFCLGWANDSWTGIWHGCADKMLMEQTYPGPEEEERHFNAILPALADNRYITVDGKPLLLIYKPYRLPEANRFIDHWQEMAIKAGLKGIYFVANVNSMKWPAKEHGFDALTPHNPGVTTHFILNKPQTICGSLINKLQLLKKKILPVPDIIPYDSYINNALPALREDFDEYPCVVPNWDNTPRCRNNGYVLEGSTPLLFKKHLEGAISQIKLRQLDKRIIFLKSWNEWAEGNYLEPDTRYGKEYLKVCQELVLPKL